MPYDITDAMNDISLLEKKIDLIVSILKEKGLIIEGEQEKKDK